MAMTTGGELFMAPPQAWMIARPDKYGTPTLTRITTIARRHARNGGIDPCAKAKRNGAELVFRSVTATSGYSRPARRSPESSQSTKNLHGPFTYMIAFFALRRMRHTLANACGVE
jgi:hypothetical protein